MSDWITLEEASALAWQRGATVDNLEEILAGCFRRRGLGITALLENAPVERVRPHWHARAAELEWMQTWRAPRHVEEFLTRACGPPCIEAGNRLRVLMLWGDGAPPYEADTCILAKVRLHRPTLAFESEAAGFIAEMPAERERRKRDREPGAEPNGKATAQPLAPPPRRGRRKGSASIDDTTLLNGMLQLLATEKEPSVWAAAGQYSDESDSTRRRLHRKFKEQWGLEPPQGKTWKDFVDELKPK